MKHIMVNDRVYLVSDEIYGKIVLPKTLNVYGRNKLQMPCLQRIHTNQQRNYLYLKEYEYECVSKSNIVHVYT